MSNTALFWMTGVSSPECVFEESRDFILSPGYICKGPKRVNN